MARYTGPKSRIARKFGEGIFGADKVLSKKNYPPGSGRRNNLYGLGYNQYESNYKELKTTKNKSL